MLLPSFINSPKLTVCIRPELIFRRSAPEASLASLFQSIRFKAKTKGRAPNSSFILQCMYVLMCICDCVQVPAFMCVPCVQVPKNARRGHPILHSKWSYRLLWTAMWVLETKPNPGSVQEHKALKSQATSPDPGKRFLSASVELGLETGH